MRQILRPTEKMQHWPITEGCPKQTIVEKHEEHYINFKELTLYDLFMTLARKPKPTFITTVGAKGHSSRCTLKLLIIILIIIEKNTVHKQYPKFWQLIVDGMLLFY